MFEEAKARLEGCVYTIFTPFGADEKIDYDALGGYIRHIYQTGGRVFYAMAYNSRYSQLSNEEILELNAFCIQTVKGLDRDNMIIVGDPIHGSTQQTKEFARHAKDQGADMVSLLVREKYFSHDQIISHYDEVGRDSQMAILVHEMPFLSGADGTQMHWPHSLFRALPKVPQIVALKEDAKDFETTCVALELEPRIRVVIAGRKSVFMNYRPHGAKAYLNGVSMVHAQIGAKFWKAFVENDQDTIDLILERIEAPFFDGVVAKYGWHRCNKALLEAAGFMSRRDRMPLQHLNDAQFEDIRAVYEEMKPGIAALLET